MTMFIESYKGRTLNVGDKVEVYVNLHNDKFSIRCAKTNLVLAHGNGFYAENCTYKVSEARRQRVIAEQSKNVHARVLCTYLGDNLENKDTSNLETIYYNPYKTEKFIKGDKVLSESPLAYFNEHKVYTNNDKFL